MPEKEDEPEDAEFVHVEPEEKQKKPKQQRRKKSLKRSRGTGRGMIWTLLPGAVFLADGCLKKKAEEELKEMSRSRSAKDILSCGNVITAA